MAEDTKPTLVQCAEDTAESLDTWQTLVAKHQAAQASRVAADRGEVPAAVSAELTVKLANGETTTLPYTGDLSTVVTPQLVESLYRAENTAAAALGTHMHRLREIANKGCEFFEQAKQAYEQAAKPSGEVVPAQANRVGA